MSAACMLGSRVALAGASVRPPRSRPQREIASRRRGPRASIAEPTKPSDASEDEKRAKVSMVSLGCPKNTVDGEVMLGDLFSNGFDVVDDHEEADAVIVNTCGFVEDAKNESVDAILAAAALKAESGQKKKVVVTGCLAQRYAEDLAEELPEVDIVMGFEEYKNLPSTVGTMLGVAETNADPSAAADASESAPPLPPFAPRRFVSASPRSTTPTSASPRVATTSAPSAPSRVSAASSEASRGTLSSRRQRRWRRRAPRSSASSRRTPTSGAWTSRRATDGGLAELLEALAEVDGVEWIRILYAYPSYFSEELIDAIADIPQVAKYIDIPLQHITNLSLLRMNRPPRQHTEDLLYKLRDRIPGLALRTTFISGFPGETEEEHEELMKFCREFKFERLGAFAYSEEDGTPAAEYPDQVEQAVRELRRDQLIAQQQEISEDFALSRVGSEVDVIVDGFNPDFNAWVGRTTLEAPDIDPIVFISEPPAGSGMAALEMGQMRKCKIVGTSLFDLEANLII